MTEIIQFDEYKVKRTLPELQTIEDVMAVPKNEIAEKLLGTLEELDYIKSMAKMFYSDKIPNDIREASGMNESAHKYFKALFEIEG